MDFPTTDPIDLTKPADTYLAEPMKLGVRNGAVTYEAIWAIPGLIPAYVEERNGERIVFPGWSEAKTGAVYAIFHTLISRVERRTNGKAMRHEKMTPEEFAIALAKLGIEPTDFANLWGSRRDRVMDWIDGKQPVPFPMWWVMDLLADPKNMLAVEVIALAHSEKR